MNLSMISASVTMGQLQKKMDTVSNNIANINTTGFKRREATFSDLLFQQVNNNIFPVPSQEVGRLTPTGIRVGSGAKVGQTAIRMEQGSLQRTDRALDVALTEKGHFFQILTLNDGAEQIRYTRDGAFYFSPSPDNPGVLELVTSEGNFVMGLNGPIVVPADHTEITITDNGTITVTYEDGFVQEVGQLDIVKVERPQLLENIGGNLFALPANLAELGFNENDVLSYLNIPEISVKQGYIEMSNVDLSKEMSDLITAQRSYQFNARSISMADQMMGLVNSIRG